MGHIHKWKIINEGNHATKGYSNRTGVIYVLQCEHCGNVKMEVLRVGDQ